MAAEIDAPYQYGAADTIESMDHRNNISVVFTISTTTDIDVYFLSGYDIAAANGYYVLVNGHIVVLWCY